MTPPRSSESHLRRFVARANFRSRRWFFTLLAGASALFFPQRSAAHALHISLGEADYRSETGRLEIALRFFTDDAEVVFSQRAGMKVVVEKTTAADLDRLAFAYVQSTFAVKKSDGAECLLRWIGHELKDANQHLWLYFECSLPEGVDGARITDRVMREAFSDQLNSIVVREHPAAGSARSDLRQTTLLFPDAADRSVVFPRKR